MEFAPRARQTSRGDHPDLVRADNGDLEFRADIDLPVGWRNFNRTWTNDADRAAFMGRLAREQAELPQHIQESIAGQEFPGDPYLGYREYLSTISQLRSYSGTEITGADVARMSLEEYDKHFDANGKPREGVTYYAGGRDVDVSSRSGIDPFSSQELRNR